MEVCIEKGFLDTISWYEDVVPKSRPFNVGINALRLRCKRMYKWLDRVIDGCTIDLITDALTLSRLVGAVGFGWYLGGLMGLQEVKSVLVC
jgi:hypothetical protein